MGFQNKTNTDPSALLAGETVCQSKNKKKKKARVGDPAHRLELVEVDAVDHAVLRHAALGSPAPLLAALLARRLGLPHARLQRRHGPGQPPLPLAATSPAAAAAAAAATGAAAPGSRGGGPLAAAATGLGRRRPGGFLLVLVVGPGAASGEVDGEGLGAGGALHVARGCVDQLLDAGRSVGRAGRRGWGGVVSCAFIQNNHSRRQDCFPRCRV